MRLWYNIAMEKIEIELTPDAEFGGFTAQVPGVPAYGAGETEEAAISGLKEAVAAYVSAFGVADALARVTRPAHRTLDVSFEEFACA